tara:strand:+ start:389 stop:499 length:111 start_codon:yes stop_codon:yes gene_type:complete
MADIFSVFPLTVIAVIGICIGVYFAIKHAEERDKQK